MIADRLALYVNDVYGAPQNFNGLQLSLGTVFFAFQIYSDFSGYTDIAMGTARVLGFELMENFARTLYHSRSSRVLASLAHFTVHLVSRLRVHPAGRQQVHAPPGAEHSYDVHDQWPLARCQLDLCCVGTAERSLSAGKHRHQRVA